MLTPSATHRYKLELHLTLNDSQLQFLQQRHAELQALSPETPFPFENYLLSAMHTQFMLWLLKELYATEPQARALGDAGASQ